MNNDFTVNTPELNENFPNWEIYDTTAVGSKLPMEWNIDRGNSDGMNTIEMVLYNYLLSCSWMCPDKTGTEVAHFIRIDFDDLVLVLNCGKSALRSAINGLKGKKYIVVLHEVGKANAYLALP